MGETRWTLASIAAAILAFAILAGVAHWGLGIVLGVAWIAVCWREGAKDG